MICARCNVLAVRLTHPNSKQRDNPSKRVLALTAMAEYCP